MQSPALFLKPAFIVIKIRDFWRIPFLLCQEYKPGYDKGGTIQSDYNRELTRIITGAVRQ